MLKITQALLIAYNHRKAGLLEVEFIASGMSSVTFLEQGEFKRHQRATKDTFYLKGVPKVSVWIDTAARGTPTICWFNYEEIK